MKPRYIVEYIDSYGEVQDTHCPGRTNSAFYQRSAVFRFWGEVWAGGRHGGWILDVEGLQVLKDKAAYLNEVWEEGLQPF